MRMRSPEDPAGHRAHAQCQSLSNQPQHKGTQCNMDGSPAEEDAGKTPAGQPPVGVVVSEDSYRGSSAVKFDYLPVGVADAFSDKLAHCSVQVSAG